MATAALFGLAVLVAVFVMLAFSLILGGNLIFNGVGSTMIVALVFAVMYFLVRYFTREKGKYEDCLKDEVQITFCSYFMMLVVGAASMYFFGEKRMPESIGSLFLTFSCVISVFLAMFFAYILEIQENNENW
ncbi:MAG: hypothetical protein IJ223_05240 [Clostridia bacterium]|nr:hypothetical protein [Clostridia bacterium]